MCIHTQSWIQIRIRVATKTVQYSTGPNSTFSQRANSLILRMWIIKNNKKKNKQRSTIILSTNSTRYLFRWSVRTRPKAAPVTSPNYFQSNSWHRTMTWRRWKPSTSSWTTKKLWLRSPWPTRQPNYLRTPTWTSPPRVLTCTSARSSTTSVTCSPRRVRSTSRSWTWTSSSRSASWLAVSTRSANRCSTSWT